MHENDIQELISCSNKKQTQNNKTRIQISAISPIKNIRQSILLTHKTYTKFLCTDKTKTLWFPFVCFCVCEIVIHKLSVECKNPRVEITISNSTIIFNSRHKKQIRLLFLFTFAKSTQTISVLRFNFPCFCLCLPLTILFLHLSCWSEKLLCFCKSICRISVQQIKANWTEMSKISFAKTNYLHWGSRKRIFGSTTARK